MKSTKTSPSFGAFAALAALLAAAFVACHALGLREHVSVLSGTAPAGGGGEAAAPLGVAYVLAWFGGVVAAPILALAAGIHAMVERLARRERLARLRSGWRAPPSPARRAP